MDPYPHTLKTIRNYANIPENLGEIQSVHYKDQDEDDRAEMRRAVEAVVVLFRDSVEADERIYVRVFREIIAEYDFEAVAEALRRNPEDYRKRENRLKEQLKKLERPRLGLQEIGFAHFDREERWYAAYLYEVDLSRPWFTLEPWKRIYDDILKKRRSATEEAEEKLSVVRGEIPPPPDFRGDERCLHIVGKLVENDGRLLRLAEDSMAIEVAKPETTPWEARRRASDIVDGLFGYNACGYLSKIRCFDDHPFFVAIRALILENNPTEEHIEPFKSRKRVRVEAEEKEAE